MLSSDIQGSNPDDLCRDLGIHGEILRKVMAYEDRWRRCAYDSRRRGEQRVEDHTDGPTQKMMCRFQSTFQNSATCTMFGTSYGNPENQNALGPAAHKVPQLTSCTQGAHNVCTNKS